MEFLKLKTFDDKMMTVCVWDKVDKPVGAVAISHGMAEHPERYDDFAKFLNKNGYIVLADNHRAHKFNIAGEKGAVDGDSWEQTIMDIKYLVEYMKKKYKLEVFLLGHSYGSFLSQRFMELYSDLIKGVVLSGTASMASQTNPLLVGFVKLINKLAGENKPAKFINKLSFGSFNKGLEDEGEFAWLTRDKEIVKKYIEDEFCGYIMSNGFYYYFLNGASKLYKEDAKSIAKDFPILIAYGDQDPVSKKGKEAKVLYNTYVDKFGLEKVEIKAYVNARHEILNETNKEEVYNDMLQFINAAFAK